MGAAAPRSPTSRRFFTGGSDLAFWPFAGTALVVAILGPIIFYPRAVTTWAAMDLATRALDPQETADAEEHRTT